MKTLLNAAALRLAIGLAFMPMFAFSLEGVKLIRSDLQYIGAFRVSNTNNGIGRTGFSASRIAISSETNSFFITGNPGSTIAEFKIPDIINSMNIEDLAFTGEPIQSFNDWTSRITHRTPNNDVKAAGPISLVDGRLVVSAFDGYDASGVKDVDNMLIIHDPFDLENSAVTGFFEMEDKMFAAGWLSPIPVNLQEKLGGDYLSGSARMASINGRWSMGPSAYSLNKTDLLTISAGATVPNIRLQMYPLHNRMWSNLPEPVNNWNYSGGHKFTDPNCPSWLIDATTPANENWKQECVLNNDLWTEVSRAHYGVIIPGTRTYLTVGRIGGIRAGIAYKIFPINGGPQPSSGEHPFDATDRDNYIWLFDVQDLIDHKNGLTESYDAMPYDYGVLPVLPFQDLNEDGRTQSIASADYDPLTNRLYIVLEKADPFSSFEAQPIVVVYEIALNRPKPPLLLH